MKSKRFEKYDLIGVILGIILIAIIGFTLYLCVRTFEKERGTAYADSTDGVVENNLFAVSTFDGLSGSTSSSMQLGTSDWYLGGSGSTNRSLSNNVLSSSAYAVSGVYAQLVTYLQNPTLYAGAAFTFSCYGVSFSYDWLLQVWYNDTNVNITVLSNTPYNTTSLKSITFTVPSTITSNGSIRLIVQTRGSVEVDWVKLEEGTSFTGYVPNDYTNYGYNQGYSVGVNYVQNYNGGFVGDNLVEKNLDEDIFIDGHLSYGYSFNYLTNYSYIAEEKVSSFYSNWSNVNLRLSYDLPFNFVDNQHYTLTFCYKNNILSDYRLHIISFYTVGGLFYNLDGSSFSSLSPPFFYDLTYNRIILPVGSTSSGIHIVYFKFLKIEVGDIFTGYVSKDYTNYGYNQGILYGLDNSVTLKGYTRVGGLADLTSDFILDNYHYTKGDYTEDLQSLYSFNKPNYAVYDSLDGEPDGTQIGFSMVSSSLYGNILITCPVADSDFTVVVENTRTSSLLFINKNDTLHYKLVGDTGVISSTWVSSMVNIEFYSTDVVNIYFISNYIRSTESAWGDYPFYFPINTPLFAVYSTASNQAFTSFEDGYDKGFNDATSSIEVRLDEAERNGYNFGYDAGHRDGVLENTDYSFTGLFGAVFDAPIKAFSGLLDFNVLGVNLKSFVLALLSLSVIVIVIKIALGGS